ncbi:glycoside hydrolase family 88 protein [Adhaeribacter swui]|uniref:Glycoside hydrolase family 88 protein n=1 Tax=Adhaeribacter swui TaxID=2086471 RepID=A0A7G7GDB9_9BACT|nr:putative Ig domain-containing protein [Adhaeribacter swui]QNF35153.1 glycoside hydrolase family 88 protein [Adhaeribacter swui]
MNYKFTLLFLILFCSSAVFGQAKLDVNKAFTHAEKQTEVMLQEIDNIISSTQQVQELPRTITESGKLRLVAPRDWTSGFFPGNLWFLYEHTQDPYWLSQAQAFTIKLINEQYDTGTHDVGFKVYNSFGPAYRLTHNSAYRQAIVQAAKSLATRFNPNTGCIRSWDHSTNRWHNPVIIDNMINLELLFAATRLSGDSTFYKIAVSHANTTLKNHFRADYSSWHVVDYDSVTGAVLKKTTAQGYSNSSAWARGQAWGLYGYTMCYRETKNKKYLDHAEKIATYILNHPNLPADGIPYWDFNAPLIPQEPRDASAAAVIASALYELSQYSNRKDSLWTAADKIMTNLASKYISPVGKNYGFILLHSTGNKPGKTEIDAPLIYADYYYLEALIRRKDINKAPQIKAISNKNITVGKTLQFTVAASDSNTSQILNFSLVKAPSGALINSKTGSFSWTPKKTGTYRFLVRVTDNGSPILYAERTVTVKVNPAKQYALQINISGKGTVTKTPDKTTYAEGTIVQLKAIPDAGYQFVEWTGNVSGSNATATITMNGNKTVNAQFALIPPQIAKINVINADADKVISALQNGATLDLAKLPAKNLTFEAIVNKASTQSVVFELSGQINHKRVETTSPLVLFGDKDGDILGQAMEVGTYSLKVTPYSAAAGKGTAGEPVVLNFKVVNTASAMVTKQIASALITSESNAVVAYPNPSKNGNVALLLPSTFTGQAQYILLSSTGAKLAEGTFDATEAASPLSLDFSRQMPAAGVYYLHVKNATMKQTLKIVRQ